MADVFISYSRKDKAFVQRLDEALRQREREAWVDWEGIRPTEEFMQAIYSAIEGADTFLFILTPDSIASVVCGKEIAHAVAQNKRMIPLVARDVNAAEVPEALAKLNWIFCRESDAFDAATDTLISALDTDLGWVRAHTRLLTRAVEWEAKGGNNSFVLRGDDLRAAEQWLTEAGTDKERQPTALQTAYIIASRKAAARRQRITLGAVTFGAVVAIVLAIVAWFQREKALRHERIANDGASHSEYLRALSLLEDNDADQALHTLARSLELAPSNSFAATRLINLLGQREWPHLAAKQKTDLPVKILKRNADGSRILLAAASGAKDSQQFFLYESLGLKLLDTPELKDFRNIEHLEVSGDTLLAMLRDSEPIALLADAKTGRKLKVWKGADEYHGNFSTDGKTAVVWNQKTIEVVSVADGKRRFSNLNFPKKIRTVTMNGTEVNILTGRRRRVSPASWN